MSDEWANDLDLGIEFLDDSVVVAVGGELDSLTAPVFAGALNATGEGPCLSAKAEGRWFYIESLAEENRWPEFVPLALEQGIHSILSSPLMTEDRPQGALNIYSSKAHAFSTRDQELAALFSAQASEILTTAGAEETDDEARQRFTSALTARQVIHQAQGMMMERNGLTTEVAAGALRRAARAAGVTVLAYAAEVVASAGTDRGAEERG